MHSSDNGKKHGWDKYESGSAVSAPKYTRAKKFGLGRSYSICIVGASGWALVQFVSVLLVSFGLAEGDLWWLTVTVNSLKWAFMLLFGGGSFLVWHNAVPEKRQVLSRVIPFVILFTVACSVFRIIVLKAGYGGFNTAGKAVVLLLIASLVRNYRKKPPYIENLWKYAGVSSVCCYISAALMGIMLMSLQLLHYPAMQYVFTFTFYGSEAFEIIAIGVIAVYYVFRKKLVRKSFEK